MFNTIINFYHILREQWKSSSEIEDMQNYKLSELVKHTYNTVPYYRNLFDSIKLKPDDIKTIHDLPKIPIMSSKNYRNIPFEEILSKKTNLNKCVITSTNGTSGLPLKIVFNKRDNSRLNSNWIRPLIANGVKPWHKRAIFSRPSVLPDKKKWYQYFGLWRSKMISIFEEPDVWIAKLQAYRPEIIYGYSGTLKLLAQYIITKKITGIKPRILFGVSEMLDEECRKLVYEAFHAKIVDLYGAAETGCISWECPTCTEYHLNADTTIVEFLKEDQKVPFGCEGRIIVTNLHSFAMPIIRYELNDIGAASNKKALCGRGLPSMKIISGRSDDFIVLPSGRLLSPRFFSATMREVTGIYQWKVTQDDSGHIIILIVPSKEFSTDIGSRLKEKIFKNAGEKFKLKIQTVDEIPPDPSGKLRAVVSTATNNAFK